MAGQQDSLDTLSNEIDEDLKTDLDIAVAGSEYNQKVVLSAMIDHCIDEEDGQTVVDRENLEEKLEEYGDRYSKD